MTDDEPQPPMKQLAFMAVHLAPATHTRVVWPAPTAVGGSVTLFVFCACCLMSTVDFLGVPRPRNTKRRKYMDSLDTHIFNPNGPYIPV